jgi:O-antigen ligase
MQYDLQLLSPIVALIILAFLQTLSLRHYSLAGIQSVTSTISADPFQTRLVISQLSALVIAGSLLVQYTTTHRRLRLLVELIIAVGVVSASFGLLRRVLQHQVGFGLPYLRPGYGFGQFINSNHFVFLMEMALGLALGIAASRAVSKSRLVSYLLAAIPMWAALILANSRAGVLSILCQVLFLAFLVSTKRGLHSRAAGNSRARFRSGRVLALRAVLIIALLTGAVITIILFGGEPLARKLDMTSVELDQKTAEVYVLRLNIWQATIGLIKDHPIAGVGFGAYWIAITQYHHATGDITPQEAHSDYLELLASGGVIGLAIGAWFVFALFRSARRKLRSADQYGRAVTLGALAGIMTVAVHSSVDYGLHITINALVLTTLVSMVVMKVEGEPDESDPRFETIGINEHVQVR